MKTVEIFSPTNDTFRTFLKLTMVRGVKKHRMALLSGRRQTEEVLKEFPDRCAGLVFSEDQLLPAAAETSNILCYRLSRELFHQLDSFGTGHPVLIVRFGTFPPFAGEDNSPGCTLCIPFQDPANVGSMIRTGAGLGVSRMVILKEAAHPFHPKSVRVAGSSIFRVPMFEGPPLEELAASGALLITLSPRGEDIAGFPFPSSFCLVPGLEGPGIPACLERAAALAIPMKNGVESLNAAIATGIVLYLWRRGLG